MAATLTNTSGRLASNPNESDEALFSSGSPLGFAGGDANLTRYVGNDALNKVDPYGLWDRPVQATPSSTGPNGEIFGPGFSDEAVAGAFEAQFAWMTSPDYLALAQLRLEWELEKVRCQYGDNEMLHDEYVETLYAEWTAHITGIGAGASPLLDRAMNSQEEEWLAVRQATIDALRSNPMRGRLPVDVVGLGMLEHGARIMQVGPHMLPSMTFMRTGPARHVWTNPPIRSAISQSALRDRAMVAQIRSDMLSGRYRFSSPEGRIAGYTYRGTYYINEGHHRMRAAMEIFETMGDRTYVNQLLEHGVWTIRQPPQPGPLPR